MNILSSINISAALTFLSCSLLRPEEECSILSAVAMYRGSDISFGWRFRVAKCFAVVGLLGVLICSVRTACGDQIHAVRQDCASSTSGSKGCISGVPGSIV
jgi:hypothetical protein